MLTPDDHTLLLGCAARPVEPEEGEGIAMALVEQAFPWAGILDPLVLAEDAGGDFVALVRAGPIAGHVVVFRHDGAPDVLARSLADWLDGVRATGELTGAHLDPRGERTQREELGAQHLVANAWGEDDWTALALAVPLIRGNVGLLAQLAAAEGVGELAEARLRQVCSRQELAEIAAGRVPAPWPVPDEVQPTVEEDLDDGWVRTQLGFGDGTVDGLVRVERDGVSVTYRTRGEVDLVPLLDSAIPNAPRGVGFLVFLGVPADGEPDAEVLWAGEHVTLTCGDRVIEWIRES